MREFKARDWPPSKLDEFREQVERFGNGEPMTSADRERTTAAFIGCKHVQRTLVEVENEHGIWGSEICVECGRQVEGPQCPHVHNSWHLDGKILVCDNCGTDVT